MDLAAAMRRSEEAEEKTKAAEAVNAKLRAVMEEYAIEVETARAEGERSRAEAAAAAAAAAAATAQVSLCLGCSASTLRQPECNNNAITVAHFCVLARCLNAITLAHYCVLARCLAHC